MAVILPFALVPLVLLPYELGYLADTRFGEKEMLIGGLLLLTLSVFLCVIISSSNPLVWICVFMVSRIGAACVETMAFTYYFKKVGNEDASLTALFNNTRPAANVVVGAVGVMITPLIKNMPQVMFIIMGCAILWCISYTLPLKDTR
jgi:predicted MFS family arabinose efflux permease